MPLDATLSQILAALYQAHATIDVRDQRIRELEAQLVARIEREYDGGLPAVED